MRKAILVVAMAMVCWPAAGDQVSDAQECSSIPDSLMRLTCFDRAFPKQADGAKADRVSEPAVQSAKWDITEDKSPIDDSPKVTAFLLPMDHVGGSFGKQPAFVMRCAENTTAVLFLHGTFVVDDTMAVTIRIGEAKATTTRWNGSTSREAVGLWTGGKAIPFIKSLIGQKRLVVRVEARSIRIDATFDLGDVDEAAAKVASACGWKTA